MPKPTDRHREELRSLLSSQGVRPFRRGALADRLMATMTARSGSYSERSIRAKQLADALVREAQAAGVICRHGHQHWVRVAGARKTLDGQALVEHADLVAITLNTKCPGKWLAVDTETGEVWQATASGNWRRANEGALAALGAVAASKSKSSAAEAVAGGCR